MTSSKPLVSVVIPCYNAETWIAETITSAVNQERVQLEVILVDDGSTDRSVEVARTVGGDAMRVICQPQGGASRARNAGTQAARGRFIQYLDSDDVLLPGAVDARVQALERTGADVAYSDWTRWEMQPDGSFAAGARFTRVLKTPDLELFTDAWWPPGALLYRRTIVDRIGPWREDLPVIQDARFLLDAALCGGSFVHVATDSLRYRVHTSASLSRRDPRAFLEDCYRSATQLQHAWEQAGPLPEPWRRAFVTAYTYIAQGFFRADRRRFRETLARLEALEPGFRPEGPRTLRNLSFIVGYPAAEHVFGWLRTMKAAGRLARLDSSRGSTTVGAGR